MLRADTGRDDAVEDERDDAVEDDELDELEDVLAASASAL